MKPGRLTKAPATKAPRMKALFNCRATSFSLPMIWQGSPYLLPLCNKPLLEYWLDLCVWLGIREVRIVEYPGTGDLHSRLRQGQEWGLNISYTHAHPDDVLPDMLLRNSAFLDQDTLVVDGLIFPFYQRKQLGPIPADNGTAAIYGLDRSQVRLNDTCLLFPHAALEHVLQARSDSERFERWTSLPLDQHPTLQFPIAMPQSLNDYYRLSLKILECHSWFHLKGFEVAPGIFEGINNEIAARPALGGPLLTGDLCKIGPDVRLHQTVLHDQIRIEGQTQLDNCLVWGPIYIADVTLANRLIMQQQCLDPQTGVWEPLELPWRLKQVVEDHASHQELLSQDAKAAQKLLLWRWPLYQMLRWAVPAQLEKFYLNANGETLIVPVYPMPAEPNPLQRAFFRWSLHRVPLLLAVREQRLLLTGTRLLQAGTEQLRYMQQLPIYAPGAFAQTDGLEPNTLTHLMEELHYISQVDDELNQSIWQRAMAQDSQLT